ncbi:MAG TPA: dihydrodipicolinate synthase family protein [Vicinamibacterales bacterium]|nr:dihydrodipicolinate synthase family protein [Vicinamibacterales bacterium]
MDLRAVFPPMPTPFRGDEVDERAIASNVARWMTTGLGGIVALGTNGEAALLDEEESDRVVAAARQAVPAGRVLIAGVGRESTKGTVAAARRAARLGADAVLVRTPSLYKAQTSVAALESHYRAVADDSPVPVLLYNYPALTGVQLTPAVVANLSTHPNVAGMKETSADGGQFADVAGVVPDRFTLLAGSAPGFYPALCAGARGGILAVACILPEVCIRVLELTRQAQYGEALALQQRLTPIARAVTSVFGIAGLKAAMDLRGYTGGPPRSPLLPAPAAAVDRLRRQISEIEVWS